ncbi:MAG: heparan-alpha-glucosaminide N-acetyltransferase [Blastocatellia bacterium]
MKPQLMTPPVSAAERIASLDTLRGLDILVMIFVNDLAGVQGAPAWMKHISPHDADGMTFVDVVFPAFLFIVGTAIPFAIGKRLEQGESLWRVWKHILTRTLSLLIIGVFMVNEESISTEGVLSPPLWSLLMYIGVILVWNRLPRQPGRKRTLMIGLRIIGGALLVTLALLYRGSGEPGLIEMRPQWWGILGLIGWAYLVARIVYTSLRTQMAGIIGMIAILYCVFMANAVGAFANLTWMTRWVDIGSMLGSHAAITVSGVVLGMMLTSSSPLKTHARRMQWALLYGLGLAAAGYLLHAAHDVHRMFIINKIFATPPWCLWCSAITVWFWIAIYWLMDVRGWQRWAVLLEPAGQNPLFAYVLAPVLYALFALSAMALGKGNFYEALGGSFAVGFWRSIIFAFAVTWLAGGLQRAGVQLKL